MLTHWLVLLQEHFVIANEVRIVTLEQLELEELVVESEDPNADTLRRPRWLQKRLHSVLGVGTTATGRDDLPGEWLRKQVQIKAECTICLCRQQGACTALFPVDGRQFLRLENCLVSNDQVATGLFEIIRCRAMGNLYLVLGSLVHALLNSTAAVSNAAAWASYVCCQMFHVGAELAADLIRRAI